NLYRQYADEMEKFALELESEIRQLGMHDGEISEMADEEPINDILKTDLNSAQKKLLSLYEQSLEMGWPGDLTEILRKQFTVAEEAEDQITDEIKRLSQQKNHPDASNLKVG